MLGLPKGETWGVKGGTQNKRGVPSPSRSKSPRFYQGKTSIPLGGRNFLVRRSCEGLEEVGKGWEGYVMLRGSLSNLYSIILHPLTHYYNFYIFAMFGL